MALAVAACDPWAVGPLAPPSGTLPSFFDIDMHQVAGGEVFVAAHRPTVACPAGATPAGRSTAWRVDAARPSRPPMRTGPTAAERAGAVPCVDRRRVRRGLRYGRSVHRFAVIALT